MSERTQRREAHLQHDVHVKVPEPLLADARRQAPHLSLGALVRTALATLAGWPDAAVQVAADPHGKETAGA